MRYTSIDEIILSIESDDIKAVSFDVFDTLLLRPCSAPIDIFRIVGRLCGFDCEQFVKMRRAAEREARNVCFWGNEDVTLTEIYEQMEKCFCLSKKKSQECMDMELEVEAKLLYQRKSAKRLFDAAIASGKKVLIISDMYLPSTFIENILKKNGYDGYYKLYVSSEYMVCKGTGNLFKKALKDLETFGIEARSVIHIGDNPKTDIEAAERCGIRACLFPRAYGMFKTNKFFLN